MYKEITVDREREKKNRKRYNMRDGNRDNQMWQREGKRKKEKERQSKREKKRQRKSEREREKDEKRRREIQ